MSARTGGLDPAAAAVRPHARRRPRRPRARRARPATSGSTRGSAHLRGARRRVPPRARRSQGIQTAGGRVASVDRRAARRSTADHYVAALPVEVMRLLARRELRAAEPRLNGLDTPRHALDERRHVLPRATDVPLVARPRDLHRLRVGADLDLPAPVLARLRLRPARRRERRRDPLGRRLGLDEPQPAATARSPCTAAARRSSTRSGRSCSDHLEDARPDGERRARVPRPGDRVPEPDGGREPRAAAGQHRRLVGATGPTRSRGSRTCSWPPTTCARTRTWRRWRAPTRRRGARSTGSSTASGSTRAAVRDLAAARAGGVRPREGARPPALEAVPPPGEAAAADDAGRRRSSPTGPVAAGLVRLGPLLRRLRG